MVRPKMRKEIPIPIAQVDNTIYDNLKLSKVIKFNRDQKLINKSIINNNKLKTKNENFTEAGITGMEALPLLRTNCKVKLKPKCDIVMEDMKTKRRVNTFVEEEDARDKESDEFFILISHCVQSAVKKAIKDSFERTINPLNAKIDELTEELSQTNAKLKKIQEDLSGKVSHYGEEGARHFRYLCMKSEYDKMFYQHQSSLTYRPCDCSCENIPPIKLEPKYSCPHSIHSIQTRHSHNVVSTARASEDHIKGQHNNLHMSRTIPTNRPLQVSGCPRSREPDNPPPTPHDRLIQTAKPKKTGSSLLIPEDTNEAISYLLDKVCPNFFVKDSIKDDKDDLPVEDYKLNIIPSEHDIAERLSSNDDSDSSDKD